MERGSISGLSGMLLLWQVSGEDTVFALLFID